MGKSQRTFRTVRSLEAAKPPKSGRVESWDEDVRGLGLRVSASGRKTWVLMYRVRGDKRLRRATLGTYPTLTLADARDQARADLRAATKGRDPASERKAERQAETFGELAEEYIERYAKKRKRSWFKDRQALDRDLLPRFRHRKAAGIKRREVIKLLEGSTAPVECVNDPIVCNRSDSCATRDIWSELKKQTDSMLESITIHDLVERQEQKNKAEIPMYFI